MHCGSSTEDWFRSHVILFSYSNLLCYFLLRWPGGRGAGQTREVWVTIRADRFTIAGTWTVMEGKYVHKEVCLQGFLPERAFCLTLTLTK